MESFKKTVKKFVSVESIAVLALLLCICEPAFAQVAGDAPWDGALCWLVNALKGKTAIAIATIAFVAAAAGFMWGEQLSGIMRTLVNVFVAVCIMLGSSSIVTRIAMAIDGANSFGC